MNRILAKQDLIENFCKKYGITFLGVFGSSARGDADEKSDIDMLVKFEHVGGLIEFIHAENELSESLQKKVEFVEEKALHPLLREKILKEVVPIYEKQKQPDR